MVLQSQDHGLEVLAAAEARLHEEAFAVVAVLPSVRLPYVRPAKLLVVPSKPAVALPTKKNAVDVTCQATRVAVRVK